MLLMKIVNNIGPRMLPCGTPAASVNGADEGEDMFTMMCVSLK